MQFRALSVFRPGAVPTYVGILYWLFTSVSSGLYRNIVLFGILTLNTFEILVCNCDLVTRIGRCHSSDELIYF